MEITHFNVEKVKKDFICRRLSHLGSNIIHLKLIFFLKQKFVPFCVFGKLLNGNNNFFWCYQNIHTQNFLSYLMCNSNLFFRFLILFRMDNKITLMYFKFLRSLSSILTIVSLTNHFKNNLKIKVFLFLKQNFLIDNSMQTWIIIILFLLLK